MVEGTYVYDPPFSPVNWIHHEITYAQRYTEYYAHFQIDDYINMLKVVAWYKEHRKLTDV